MKMIQPPRFSFDDAQRAHDEWGCNCGPGAIAAICGLTLDEVRPLLLRGDFESKRYTNPTLMLDVIGSLHVYGIIKSWSVSRLGMPNGYGGKVGQIGWPTNYGLVRIQWEGPWTKPGVPMRARYRHTHWIGAARRNSNLGIFDINCMNNGTGWVSLENWRNHVVPWILQECVPRADGNWHITHAIEVDRAHAEVSA